MLSITIRVSNLYRVVGGAQINVFYCTMTNEPDWLLIGRELRAIAQTGLTFCKDVYDRQRYERVRELAAQLLASRLDLETAHLLEMFHHDAGYATPKVDVRGAAFRDGKILMVREISDGCWTLPGGWADVNQTPAECVVREINEESGFTAKALKIAAIQDYQRSNSPPLRVDSIYKIFFLCELTGGAARASDETSEVAFFALTELPALSAGRSTRKQIELMFEHAAHWERLTDFE